jgi:3-deoxy-7-phosphoheptulonate synthase
MTQAPLITDWHPASWQTRLAAQQPTYPDQEKLARAISELSQLPGIVVCGHVITPMQ